MPRILSTTKMSYSNYNDYSLQSSSSSLPPPSPKMNSNRRSSSPIHHLSIPASYSSSGSSRYSPSSRASDASRLLDPSYAPRRVSVASTAAYVDHHGDLHDPDYRDFPAVVTPIRRISDPEAEDDENDSDDEAATASIHSNTYPSSIASHHRRASSVRRRAERESLTRSTNLTYRPSFSLDSPPASYGSFDESPFSEDDSAFFGDEKESKRKSRRGSRMGALLRVEAPVEEEQSEEIDYRVSAYVDPSGASKEMTHQQPEWTPTCGQSVKRKWQAVALSFRITVFRAKRNIRRRSNSV